MSKLNKYFDWAKRHKIWAAVLATFLLFVIVSAANPPEDKPKEQKQSASTSQPTETKQEQPKPQQPAAPKYEVLKEYGTGGKAVLIDPADASDDKLTLLGKELDKKYGSETLVRIGVFTDRKYALISTDFDAIGNMSDADTKAYDQAYAAQFNVNKNTNFKQYILRPSLDAKEIKL